MAELTRSDASCCAPEARASCCEPSDKAACCGGRAAGGSCGCSAGRPGDQPAVPDIRGSGFR